MYKPIGFRDSTGVSNIYMESTENDYVYVTKVESETFVGTAINVANMNQMETGIDDIHTMATAIRANARKQLRIMSFLRWELETITGNPSVDMATSSWFSLSDDSEINLVSGTITELGFGL